jgi:hypothetical protein
MDMTRRKFLKWWEILILSPIILAGLAYAQWAYESITVSYTAKTLTYSSSVRRAFIIVDGNDIRYTLDGVTVPTSGGTGHKFPTTSEGRWLNAYEVKNFKAVRASSSADAVLKVTYYQR